MPYVTTDLAGFSIGQKLGAVAKVGAAIIQKARGDEGAAEKLESAKLELNRVVPSFTESNRRMGDAILRFAKAEVAKERQRQQVAQAAAQYGPPQMSVTPYAEPVKAGLFDGFDMKGMLPLALVLSAAFLFSDLKKAPRKRSYPRPRRRRR